MLAHLMQVAKILLIIFITLLPITFVSWFTLILPQILHAGS
jgi:hypothetical protein